MLRQFFIIYFFLLVLLLTALGFRGCKSSREPLELFPDMDRQAKYLEQGKNTFFPDGRNDRPHVPGAVPYVDRMGEVYPNFVPPDPFYEDTAFATGKDEQGEYVAGFPIEVNAEAMQEGQKLFNLYCAVCHGESGDGEGVLKAPRYGFVTIASLLQGRLEETPEGHLFETITYGRNTMGPYGAKLRPEERWQVVLYVRALQRAGAASIDDVPAEHRGDLGL